MIQRGEFQEGLRRMETGDRLQALAHGLMSCVSRGPSQRVVIIASLLALVITSLVACSESAPRRRKVARERVVEAPPSPEPEPEVRRAPTPPWETWAADARAPRFERALAFAERGDVAAEEEAYREVETDPTLAPEVREEAFKRRLGAMLKSGRSKEVLTEVSRYARSQGRGIDQLGAQIALIVAFSYEHQRDIDQTFAWLSLANRGERSDVALRARAEAVRLIRKIRQDAFQPYSARWESDTILAGLFRAEEERRRVGGSPIDDTQPGWFSPATYRGEEAIYQPSEELNLPSDNKTVVGAVLPFTGQYRDHALRVQNGIELALEQFDTDRRLKILYGDNGGEAEGAAREYDNLATAQGAAVVLGPLLVKSAEMVASRSEGAAVPFLTFTKRPGITGLSPVAFRLGATAENQLSEVVQYVRQERQLSRFATLSTAGSAEFLASFTDVVTRNGGEVVLSQSFQPNNQPSLESALQELIKSAPQVVFLPDALEVALPVIQLIRESALKEVVIIGPAAWDDPVFIRGYGGVLDGTLFVTPFFAQSERRGVVEFRENFEKRFGKAPDLLSAQAFDATRLVVEALRGDPKGVAERLRALPVVVGVTGALKVNENGEITRRMSVVQIYRGQPVEVMAGGVPTGGGPAPLQGEQNGAEINKKAEALPAASR